MARLFAYIPRGCLWCAFGTLSPTARPSRVLLTPWGFAPHPRSPRGRGAGDAYGNTCTPTTDRWVASDQSRPWPLRGCCASLDSSPAPFVLTGFLGSSKLISKILRISDMKFLVSEFLNYCGGIGRGSRAAKPCIFTLDA